MEYNEKNIHTFFKNTFFKNSVQAGYCIEKQTIIVYYYQARFIYGLYYFKHNNSCIIE